MKTRSLFLSIATAVAIASQPVNLAYGGAGEWSEQAIQNEIGFLAQKLLEMSGKDSYSCDVESYVKPFIGICTAIDENGIELTCVTPGTQADKSGLRTGDIVQKMNGHSMKNKDIKIIKSDYYEIVKKMKTGDVIEIELLRAGKKIQKNITVGSRKAPAYSLKVSK